MRNIYILAIMAIALISAGCATKQRWGINDAFNKPDSEIYNTGTQAVKTENFDAAIHQFKSLEVYYPDSPYTRQALLELAYAYYKNNSTSSAIAAADRFIQTYPDHSNIDYAYYIKGLASFKQAVDELDVVPGPEMPANSPSAWLSLQYFSALLTNFPDSTYKNDSQQRITYLKERLAQRELSLATYYIQQGSYANAALHAKIILEKYPQSPAVPAAVSLTNEAYRLLKFSQTPTTYIEHLDNINNAIQNPIPTSETNPVTPAFTNKHPDNINNDIQNPVSTPETGPATSIFTHEPVLNNMSTPGEISPEKNNIEISNASSMSPDEPDAAAGKPEQGTTETILSAEASGIKREPWITAQNPDYYTLQLLGSRNEKQLSHLIKTDTTARDMAYFKSMRNNESWYSLVYGVFPTITEAKAAFEDIPAYLKNDKPWIRTFDEIHHIMDQASGPAGNITN